MGVKRGGLHVSKKGGGYQEGAGGGGGWKMKGGGDTRFRTMNKERWFSKTPSAQYAYEDGGEDFR